MIYHVYIILLTIYIYTLYIIYLPFFNNLTTNQFFLFHVKSFIHHFRWRLSQGTTKLIVIHSIDCNSDYIPYTQT